MSSVLAAVRRRFGHPGQLLGSHEMVLLLSIVGLAFVVGLANPGFWSPASAFQILRMSYENMIFALAVLIVMVAGGIDVSFLAIGIFAGHATVILMRAYGIDALLPAFGAAAVIGMLLGLLNGVVVAGFRIPTLIATLGTSVIFRGVLLAFIGRQYVADIPAALDGFAKADLIRFTGPDGAIVRLHVVVLPIALLCLGIYLLLRYTLIGRAIFALGGSEEAARRVGFGITRTRLVVFVLAGLLSGLGGMLHVSLSRASNPFELVGNELSVIAAVVLGGTRISGGIGSVPGTVLGVLLISLMNSSLIALGVPSFWQRAAVGLLLLIGVSAPVVAGRLRSRRRPGFGTPAEADGAA